MFRSFSIRYEYFRNDAHVKHPITTQTALHLQNRQAHIPCQGVPRRDGSGKRWNQRKDGERYVSLNASVENHKPTHNIPGYPHAYGNADKLKFYKDCLKAGVQLLEYPVYEDKAKLSYQKDKAKNDQKGPGPVRVVSTTDHNKFCGVMTHTMEDDQGRGTGPFKLCEFVLV